MKVVKAKKNNAGDISKIISNLDTKEFHFSDLKKIEKQINTGWYFIAVDEKTEIQGAIALRKSSGAYEIYAISSAKKGVGKALIDFAIQKCEKEKVPKLWCWSLRRYKARDFYKKMGFTESFLLKKQWHREDCYFFGRSI